MTLAYQKRVCWEARIQAVEIGKVIAELMGGKSGGPGAPRSKQERVRSTELLSEMGVKVKGKKPSPPTPLPQKA